MSNYESIFGKYTGSKYVHSNFVAPTVRDQISFSSETRMYNGRKSDFVFELYQVR